MTRRLLLAGSVALTGCVRYPEPYRPPIQRNPVEIEADSKLSHFIAMNGADAERHIVDGALSLNDGSWRWCMKRAVFQFNVPDARHKKLLAEITIPELTFQQTGPVKITVTVGPHVLDTIAFDKPEVRTWEKAAPREWISTDEPVLVSLEIDKMWRSPADGAERGFILTRVGFVE